MALGSPGNGVSATSTIVRKPSARSAGLADISSLAPLLTGRSALAAEPFYPAMASRHSTVATLDSPRRVILAVGARRRVAVPRTVARRTHARDKHCNERGAQSAGKTCGCSMVPGVRASKRRAFCSRHPRLSNRTASEEGLSGSDIRQLRPTGSKTRSERGERVVRGFSN